jgi:hypothetical protein
VIAAGEGLVKHAKSLDDLVGGIDVQRSAETAGQGFERDLATGKCGSGLRVCERAGRCGAGRDQELFFQEENLLS